MKVQNSFLSPDVLSLSCSFLLNREPLLRGVSEITRIRFINLATLPLWVL